MIFVVTGVVAAFIVGMVASSRGRSGIGWFLLSLIITPIITLVLLLLLSNRRPQPVYLVTSTGAPITTQLFGIPTQAGSVGKTCPSCGRVNQSGANRCSCGAKL